MNKLIIYIVMSSLLPVLKQMYILKFLNYNYIDIYGLIFAISSFFIGFSHLGWAEISAIKTSQKKSIHDQEKIFSYHFALYSISFINIFFIPIIFYIQNIDFYFLFFIIPYVISLSIFQLNNKVIRSYNILKLFFILIIIKNFIDMFLFIILKFIGYFFIEIIFSIETLSSLFLIMIAYQLKIFIRFKYNILSKKLFYKYKLFFIKNKYHAFNIFMTSIFSLILIYSDRIIYYNVLSKVEYVEFMFYLIVINLFMSVNALFYSLLYNKLSNLQLLAKEEMLFYLDKIFIRFLTLILSLPVLIISTKYIQNLFYANIASSIVNISLVLTYASLIVINIYEKYNLLSKNKYTKYLQLFVLSIFILSLFILYKMSIINLTYALTITVLIRVIYIILNREIIRR